MFARESDMATAVIRWLNRGGMTVKREFVTPWGICDLVGLKFDKVHVQHRLKLKQTKPVSSILRARLLLQIPDVGTRKSITLDKLVQQIGPVIPAETIYEETARLIEDRFILFSSVGRLQKKNGWMPLQKRLVAVELKLTRIEEAMRQALNNLGFAEESYVGLPADAARRVASNPSRWSVFFDKGIGLLGVAQHGCRVLIPPGKTNHWVNSDLQFYCVEKFWRTRSKDS